MSHLVYKTLITSDNILCTAELLISSDAQTTENRQDIVIVDRKKAKFRCSMAKVISIKTLNGKNVDEAYSQHDRSFVYRVGEVVTSEIVGANQGIHYFLSPVLYIYNWDKIKYSGEYTIYDRSGSKFAYMNLVNGQKHGPCIEYYENGKIKEKGNYIKGFRNGYYTTYYDNGKLETECDYVRGKRDGRYVEYYANGRIKDETTYIEGVISEDSPSVNRQ